MGSKLNLAELIKEYESYKALGLKLDMSRGKPAPEQLGLSDDVLGALKTSADCFASDGTDCRNYGGLNGISEARRLFAQMLEVPEECVIIGGNSSLNMMFDTALRAYTHGVKKGAKPWSKYDKVTFLCPAPGYDRHFAITEYLGINMIAIPMTDEGPDMDVVESYVKNDETVKGFWCVPRYSNPTGITYSDRVVKRLAALKPKADDFRVFWDDAYAVHTLEDKRTKLLNVLEEAKKHGNEDLFYVFTSTSKITFAGAGIAALACSPNNVAAVLDSLKWQTIGYDKLNQLRHAKVFPNMEAIETHMKKHAALIRPKFEAVLKAFSEKLTGLAEVEWTKPTGGYFISLDVPTGCAKRVVMMAKEAGVTLTPAGATYPYGKDPVDRNIRIAPTYPSLAELEKALDVLCCCVKIVVAEKQ
ncbi:MAG: aminotransferase [Eubacteriales bacterium]|nr:aminotransferase [Eubacteriales bacterium]MDD4475968.1 aminotransferase [Eubacteriales bacterium]